MNNLQICMLGNPAITLNNRSITSTMSNKAVALLCYLAFNKDKAYSRDKLASVFWDSANIETTRYNLRYTLWSLRKVLDSDKKQTPIITTYKDSCRINPDADIYTDVSEMEKLIEEIRKSEESDCIDVLHKVKNIYKGEFLEGFYINKCPEFNDWVFFERERLQKEYFEVLYSMTRLYKSAGNYIKSIGILNEMLKINPLQENIYEELIKNYLELGDRASALSQYKRCSNILRDELNISPNENIRKLCYDIKSSSKYFNEPVQRHSNTMSPAKLQVILKDGSRAAKAQNIPEMENTISIICYPSFEVSYSTLSDCIKLIIDNFSHELLRKLPQNYWKDISRIESSAKDIYSIEANADSLTPESEKIRIFSALERLFNLISSHMKFCISIKSLQFMDKISLEFLKFYISRNRCSCMTFILEGCDDESLYSGFINLVTE